MIASAPNLARIASVARSVAGFVVRKIACKVGLIFGRNVRDAAADRPERAGGSSVVKEVARRDQPGALSGRVAD